MAINQQSRQTYNYPLPTSVLTPASVGTYIQVNTGVNMNNGWVLIYNESPYRLQVLSPSLTSQAIQPQTVDKIKLIPGDQVIQILPSLLIPGSSPSSKVDYQVYPGADNEPAGDYPMPLNRQSAPVAASSQSGYTAFFTYSSSGSTPPAFNIFNPSNSGVVGTFYYCRVSTSGGSGAAATLYYFIGGDINIAVPVNIQPADPVNQGASQFHATGTVNQNIIQAVVPWESILALAAGQQYDLIPFPDQKTIRPGENIIVVITGPFGQSGSISMKWNEG